ncbi:MAG: phage holin [Dorea sp.]|nr:phage holin [Dorea sp.]
MNNVKTETIIRTVLLVFALINQALAICGKSPIPVSDETLSQCISMMITVAASLWAWWKNNSFTKEAIMADEFLEQLREVEDRE